VIREEEEGKSAKQTRKEGSKEAIKPSDSKAEGILSQKPSSLSPDGSKMTR